MTYLKWQCTKCNSIIISNSNRHHEMDFCKCKETGVDLEEDYCRASGYPLAIKEYDYNFFDELVLGMLEQGFLKLIRLEGKKYLDLVDVIKIRALEDEITESLK